MESVLDTETLQNIIRDLFSGSDAGLTVEDAFSENFVDFGEVSNAQTFGAACLLTSNDGVVLRMKDGSEFQITVVRSK